MRNIDTEILNELIIGRVEPHIYAFSTRTIPNYLKIGDTYRPVELRLEEWRKYFPNLERHFSDIAKVDTETFFRDYSIHHFLERDKGKIRLQKGIIDGLPYYSNEFFKNTDIKDIEEAINDIKESHFNNNGKYQFYRFDNSHIPINYKWARTEEFKPRPNQQETINRFKEAVNKGRTNLLMYAVMRFGKSFTSMCCAAEINAKFVVIVSAKADVKAEWKRTVESHIRFDGYEFIDNDYLMCSESAITDKLKESKIVLFLTLQDLQGDKIKNKHKNVFSNKIDLLLIDETHFGARATEFGKVLERLNVQDKKNELKQYDDNPENYNEPLKILNSHIRIHLSGTPYRILMGSEFTKDDIISFCQFTDIVNEQERWDKKYIVEDIYGENTLNHKKGEQVKEWDNPYYGFPQMVRFAFNLNKASIKTIEKLKENDKISSAFNELFRPESIRKDEITQKHKKFRHKSEILDLLEVIDGTKSDENLLGFLDYDKIKQGKMCRHIVCVLPYRASCDALEELIKLNIKRFKNLNDYKIINIAGVEDEQTYNEIQTVKNTIEDHERNNKKTLTLTVNRMLTGSTVKEWDTMLYLKDTSSPQEYDQAIFRLQNQYITTYKDENGDAIKYNMKPQTLLIDFAPVRMFTMQEQKSQIYNANIEKNGNDKLEDRIKRELEISPIIVLNHNKIHQVTPTDILSAVSKYSCDRSVNDEANSIPIDLSLLDDEDIRTEIERQAEINSREGLKIKAIKGEGDNIDGLDTIISGENNHDEVPSISKPPKVETDEIDSIRKKFATYYSRILFFAFLTKTKVKNLNEIINVIDANNENKRISENISLHKNILTLFKQKMNPFILNKLDYKIQNLNKLATDINLEPLDRAANALKKFGRLADSEIVTPAKIADNMVAIIPKEHITNQTKILDIAAKQGEFAIAMLKHFGEKIKPNIYSITTSLIAYEFTRKIYETLEIPIENIFNKFNSYDIIGDNNEAIIKQLNSMKFNVVVGNPPYHENDGGGRESAAVPLYNRFVQQAKQLSSNYICMIIPARWYSGGRGLDDFRNNMLNDNRLTMIHDFPETSDCFDNLNIRGGICYFLWDKSHIGDCKIINYKNQQITSESTRPLLEPKNTLFVRYNKAISILHKIKKAKEETFDNYVSTQKPFGFRSNFEDFDNIKSNQKSIKLYRYGELGYINIDQVKKNKELATKWKVIASKASPGGDEYPHQILSRPIISEPNSVCTETYLIIKTTTSEIEAQNIISYIHTRFFRFMVSLIKNTQNISRSVYAFVPVQDFSKPWTDDELYKKYDLTEDEIDFIKSMIKPIDNI